MSPLSFSGILHLKNVEIDDGRIVEIGSIDLHNNLPDEVCKRVEYPAAISVDNGNRTNFDSAVLFQTANRGVSASDLGLRITILLKSLSIKLSDLPISLTIFVESTPLSKSRFRAFLDSRNKRLGGTNERSKYR